MGWELVGIGDESTSENGKGNNCPLHTYVNIFMLIEVAKVKGTNWMRLVVEGGRSVEVITETRGCRKHCRDMLGT